MPTPVNSPAAALELMLSRLRPLATERVPLHNAAGRILAEPITADRDSPAIDVSAMDGYSVRLADLAAGFLPISGEVRIGATPPAQPAAASLRIVTGAPIPPGAEAVIKREDVEELPDRVNLSPAALATKPGTNIRRRAENAAAGKRIASSGILITAPIAAALASFGIATPLVFRRVRIGILTTGDEVLDVSDSPKPWQLRDSNGPALATFLSTHAWAEVAAPRTSRDDPVALRDSFHTLLRTSDAVIATGGVSMGDRDFIPQVIRNLGAEVLFHKVPQRPGRPILGASLPDGRPIFGLPGNPLSVMVTARRIVLPTLERFAGLAANPPRLLARLENPDDRRLDLWWHRSVRLTGPGTASLVDVASSGDVASAASGDGFVEIPPNQGGPGPWPYYSWS